MELFKRSIPDVVLIKPKVISDDRGYFLETFIQDKLKDALGYQLNFCQDNESKSKKGVLRGLHFQLPPFAQSKLVRVIEGEILDVSVDIREGSPTFGKYVAEHLSGENKHQLFIPRGFAHGFLVLSEWAIISYKVDNYYSSECETGLAFDDPILDIKWGISKDQIQLSNKDLKQRRLENLIKECSKFNFRIDLYA
jgi:dTDP-4-dehydrorhamnose 3,5-epimerase